MRNILAITFTLAVIAVSACGSSNKNDDSCDQSGGVCLNTGASCGDTLPYACPSGGVCCSPTRTGDNAGH
ncbi:MAG TPA: hypothetical protein VGI39_08010 [Polyangiaceae bacterium]|jgi:hypothetical protein